MMNLDISQKVNTFWDSLVSANSSITEDDKKRQARIISGLGLIILFALIIGTIAAYARDADPTSLLSATILILLLYLVSRTPYTTLAGVGMLIVTTLPSFIFFASFRYMVSDVPVYAGAIWLALPIVIGGLILPVGGAVIVNIFIVSTFLMIKLFVAPELDALEFGNSFSFLLVLSLVMTLTLQVREVYLVRPQIEKLVRANRVKDEFLATMSHELRTPLNSIIGYSSILQTGLGGEIDEEAERFISKIGSSSEGLLALITDILDISKIESGEVDITLQDVSIQDLQKSWNHTFITLAKEKGIKFDIQLANDLPQHIQTDPNRITQIVTNLVTNAIKFTEQGHVSLQIAKQHDNLIMSVEDTGIGIPQDQIETIFDKFKQVDSTYHRKYQGTGLGLAITKHLVTLFGGHIHVDSTVNRGSTFTVTLPI